MEFYKTSLSNEIKRQCRDSYTLIKKEISAKHYQAVNKYLERTVKRLSNSDEKHKRLLAISASELFHFYKNIYSTHTTEARKIKTAIEACLYYLVDTFDVIPDTDNQQGYLDDLYIVQVCLRDIKSVNNYYAETLKSSILKKEKNANT